MENEFNKIGVIPDLYERINQLENTGLYGWICPKCGRTISPYQVSCPFCNNTVETATNTSIDKEIKSDTEQITHSDTTSNAHSKNDLSRQIIYDCKKPLFDNINDIYAWYEKEIKTVGVSFVFFCFIVNKPAEVFMYGKIIKDNNNIILCNKDGDRSITLNDEISYFYVKVYDVNGNLLKSEILYDKEYKESTAVYDIKNK